MNWHFTVVIIAFKSYDIFHRDNIFGQITQILLQTIFNLFIFFYKKFWIPVQLSHPLCIVVLLFIQGQVTVM